MLFMAPKTPSMDTKYQRKLVLNDSKGQLAQPRESARVMRGRGAAEVGREATAASVAVEAQWPCDPFVFGPRLTWSMRP
jgi:hypothetical protein